MAFLVMNITLSLFACHRCLIHLHAPHLKRNALHDSENERRELVSVLLGIANDPANRWCVVVLDASSECKGEKLLRQCCRKHFWTAQQRVFKSIDSSELSDAGQSRRRIDGLSV